MCAAALGMMGGGDSAPTPLEGVGKNTPAGGEVKIPKGDVTQVSDESAPAAASADSAKKMKLQLNPDPVPYHIPQGSGGQIPGMITGQYPNTTGYGDYYSNPLMRDLYGRG